MAELAAALARRRDCWADEILPWLYLGSGRDAENLEQLRKHISHVLNVADDVPNFHEGEEGLQYCRLDVQDFSGDAGISRVFETAADFLLSVRDSNGTVLVHCANGSNRSATVVIAALMQIESWTLRQAFDHARSCHRATAPLRKESAELAAFEIRTKGLATMDENDFVRPASRSS